MIGMVVGSIIGGFVPLIFGASLLSYESILGNGIGGLVGIFLVFKLTEGW